MNHELECRCVPPRRKPKVGPIANIVRDAWVGVGAGREPALEAVVATDRAAAELRAALLADTAAWKIPKKLKSVAALPLTTRGKTDLRALRAMMA